MKKILPVLPSKVKVLQAATQQLKHQANLHELRPIEKEDGIIPFDPKISSNGTSFSHLISSFLPNLILKYRHIFLFHYLYLYDFVLISPTF